MLHVDKQRFKDGTKNSLVGLEDLSVPVSALRTSHSSPATGIEKKIGTVSIKMFISKQLPLSTHSFNQQEVASLSPQI
jgi:hypothetical protein